MLMALTLMLLMLVALMVGHIHLLVTTAHGSLMIPFAQCIGLPYITLHCIWRMAVVAPTATWRACCLASDK